ncbi:MAG TPA: MerR family transcriptional regulator [Acidimicrobiales bacterium]|nr:MerR family transcriptional regulator [Acidimicrobiales bacterium]
MSELLLDELARLAGTTGRNVRAFQTHGLLPRPRLVGRRGFYGTAHLQRLRAILRLQADGFSLGAIAALFAALDKGLTLEQVLGVRARREAHRLDDEDLFVGWPSIRSGQLLSAVPSTVLSLPAA